MLGIWYMLRQFKLLFFPQLSQPYQRLLQRKLRCGTCAYGVDLQAVLGQVERDELGDGVCLAWFEHLAETDKQGLPVTRLLKGNRRCI